MPGLSVPLPVVPASYASVVPVKPVTVIGGGDETTGYDTTATDITQLTTVFSPSAAEIGDSVEITMSTNLPQNREFAVYLNDGTTEVQLATISPNTAVGSAQIVVDFKILFINSASGQFRGLFKGVSSGNLATLGVGFATGLDLTKDITIYVRTSGTWTGGEGLSYIDGFQTKILTSAE